MNGVIELLPVMSDNFLRINRAILITHIKDINPYVYKISSTPHINAKYAFKHRYDELNIVICLQMALIGTIKYVVAYI